MTRTITLTFHPASNPPDDDTTVLCACDGEAGDVFTGWKDGDDWYDCTGQWVEVKAWAHLPEPEACIP